MDTDRPTRLELLGFIIVVKSDRIKLTRDESDRDHSRPQH